MQKETIFPRLRTVRFKLAFTGILKKETTRDSFVIYREAL